LLPDRIAEIRQQLAEAPAYLPFWRSEAFGSAVTAVRFSKDEQFVLASFADGKVRRWNLADLDAAPEIIAESIEPFEATGVTLDGRTVRFHAFGKNFELTAHPAEVKTWTLRRDQSALFVGLADGTVMAWDFSGRPLGSDTGLLSVIDQGWFGFDKQQDLVPGSRTSAGRTGFGGPAAPEPFDPARKAPFRNSLGMRMLHVAPGEFLMGSPETEKDRGYDEVQHPVLLTRDFWLGQFEVTQAEWEAVMETNPSDRPDPLAPVEQVSWIEADEFCRKLTEREHQTGLLPQDWTYALPTEAQWEYACRAGTAHCVQFREPEEALSDYGWFDGNSGNRTHAVGSKLPNPWGFHDLHGNVYEWCRDWHSDSEFQESKVTPDPTGPPSGDNRVHRGGSWIDDTADDCRSAARSRDTPDYRYTYLGFRLAAVPSSLPRRQARPERLPDGEGPEACAGGPVRAGRMPFRASGVSSWWHGLHALDRFGLSSVSVVGKVVITRTPTGDSWAGRLKKRFPISSDFLFPI